MAGIKLCEAYEIQMKSKCVFNLLLYYAAEAEHTNPCMLDQCRLCEVITGVAQLILTILLFRILVGM